MNDLQSLAKDGYFVDPAAFDKVMAAEPDVQATWFKNVRANTKIGFNVKVKERVLANNRDLAFDIFDPEMKATLQAHVGKSFAVKAVHINDEFFTSVDLDGFPLRLNAGYFEDARPTVHEYGVLSACDSRVFVTYFDGVSETPVAKETYEISFVNADLCSDYQVAVDLSEFAKIAFDETSTVAGEFAIADNGAAGWSLEGMPWTSGTTEPEREIAKAAVQGIIVGGPSLG
jgi:hypothetical protein